MELEFRNKHLQKLYEEGKSRKYRLQKQTLRKFFIAIGVLESAQSIHDLWRTPSFNFEKLAGFKDKYSVRLNKEWRLEMSMEWTDKERTVGSVLLHELSNHYGD